METNRILQGDALEQLRLLPDQTINCIVTSPPYWALRDYGVEGQLGLEPTFQEYINKLCDIFDECKRVLRDDGTLWVNIGDSYSGSGAGTMKNIPKNYNSKEVYVMPYNSNKKRENKILENKSLCNIPARFSIEMQNRGWILRNEIIWHKPNCMPASISDRFTVDFEKIYFFVKKKKYWFEQQTEPHQEHSIKRALRARNSTKGKEGNYAIQYQKEYEGYENMKEKLEKGEIRGIGRNGRNKRTTWTITTKGFKEAHFAVYPEELIETPIQAGCPEHICKKCGFAREKIMETNNPSKEYMEWDAHRLSGAHNSIQSRQCIKSLHRNKGGVYSSAKFKGFSDCDCNAGWTSGIVLDPFFGSGTTGVVALKQNKQYIGIELNPEYIRIAEDRIKPYKTQTKLPK